MRLTAGGQTETRSFDGRSTLGVTRDGVTQADLEEQAAFLLKVRDAIGDVRRLQQNIEAGLKKAGIDGLPMAVPGAIPTQIKFAHPLQGCWRASSTRRESTRSRCCSASCRTCSAWQESGRSEGR